MPFKKKIQLDDGSEVLLEPFNGKEDAREFQHYINTLTKEGTYLLVEKPVTLKEEEQWLKNQYQAQKKGEQICLKALSNGRLIGDCFARRGIYRENGNVNLGIAIEKNWRGKGLGRRLMQELILLVEQKWEPVNIYLHVVVVNRPALRLYQSLGFRVVARLPYWFSYGETYYDEFLLILDKKYFYKQLHAIKKKNGLSRVMFFQERERDDR